MVGRRFAQVCKAGPGSPIRDEAMSEGRMLGADGRTRSFVSADEVARHAGVSRSAVSRTFTPGASVSDETRRRVMSAAEALGYHVNHLARGLTRQQSGIVCVIASDIESPQIARLVRALSERLQAEGRVAMVLSLKGGDDPGAILQRALHYRAEATIVVSGTPSQSIVRSALASGQRLILINRDDPLAGPDNIRIRNEAAAETALRAFLRAGCRHLALFGSERRSPSLALRETAFLAAARALGLEPQVVREGLEARYENGVAAAQALFTGPQRPDAVFCVNDLMALGAMDSIRHDFRLSVPADVSVIGFDDIPQAAWASYGLTTFSQPYEPMANAAAALVAEGPQEGEAACLEFVPTLVWRRTVRPEMGKT
jgi:DNA-binding LacI/PurR family transcriptional regulator